MNNDKKFFLLYVYRMNLFFLTFYFYCLDLLLRDFCVLLPR